MPTELYTVDLESKPKTLPLYLDRVAAGFPSPADDYVERRLDLNQHLIRHPEASFFVRVKGDSMRGAGIHPNDLLIVDRALEATDGRVVVVALDGELTVKRLRLHGNELALHPENPAYPVIRIKPDRELLVWGVATYVIHAL
jgi:DNA polymerase V